MKLAAKEKEQERNIIVESVPVVLLASYNGAAYIEEQLCSLARQTFRNFKCYIHDDGSVDETKKIISRFCGKNPDRFFLLDAPPCGGAKKNFLYLLKKVDAPYVLFCDQDDVWLPDKLEKTLEKMRGLEANGEAACVYTDVRVTDGALHTVARSFYQYTGKNPSLNRLYDLLNENVAVGCTLVVNRALRKAALAKLDEDLIFMHDWWLVLVAAACGRIGFLDSPLVLYRQHSDNCVGARKKKSTARKALGYLRFINKKKVKKRSLDRTLKFVKALAAGLDGENRYQSILKEYAALDSLSKPQKKELLRRLKEAEHQ